MRPLVGFLRVEPCGRISLFPVEERTIFFLLWLEREVGGHLQARKGTLIRNRGKWMPPV